MPGLQPEANAIDEDFNLIDSRFPAKCVERKQEENFAHFIISRSSPRTLITEPTFVLNKVMNLDERERTTFS